MDALAVEDFLAGARHALTDLALLQVRGQGKAPVAQDLPTFLEQQGTQCTVHRLDSQRQGAAAAGHIARTEDTAVGVQPHES